MSRTAVIPHLFIFKRNSHAHKSSIIIFYFISTVSRYFMLTQKTLHNGKIFLVSTMNRTTTSRKRPHTRDREHKSVLRTSRRGP